MTRSEREQKAYDEDGVYEVSNSWQRRFIHVFRSPNTLAHEAKFRERIFQAAKGKRVLDLGCGYGQLSNEMHEAGAAYVLGIDVAESFLAKANETYGKPGVVEFKVVDADQPLEGKFDLIVGASVLHHIDYRTTLRRLYDENLSSGGLLAFDEPLGGNLLIRAYTALIPRAHTPDERSFMKSDLKWLRQNFPKVTITPYNFFTLPVGIVTSKLMKSPDNMLLRAAHSCDLFVARTMRFLESHFRRCSIEIARP
ncbi:MAG: class I SAM-dependent methyltransferase [Fimbriimonadaceae bacterium]